MPGEAALVPMDGYHFDNAVLVERGLLPRKGAPQTFDVDGLARDLERIRAGGPRGRRPGLRPHPRPGAGRGALDPPGAPRDRDRGQLSPARPAALERARAAASTARSSSRSTGPSCAGGWSTAGWRTDWTPPPPVPAPRGTTCPTPSWWRPAGGRPICSGGTENRPSASRKSDAASGDHLLNSRGSPRVTFGFVPKKSDLGKKPTVVSKNFRRVSGHEHPPTLQWPERLW